MNATATVETKCGKCQGKGHLNVFQNVAGGVCFDCKGAGKFVETVEKVKRRKARIEADKRRAVAQMEANLNRMAPLHAVWEQRADLIFDRNPEIHPAAMSHFAQRDELWEADMKWTWAVDSNRSNCATQIGY